MADQDNTLRRSPVRHFLSDQKMAAGLEFQVLKIWLAFVFILAIGAIQIASPTFAGVSLLMMVGALMFFRNMTKNDAFSRKKYMRYMRQANVYEPWPQVRPEGISGNVHARPLGFGRNRLV